MNNSLFQKATEIQEEIEILKTAKTKIEKDPCPPHMSFPNTGQVNFLHIPEPVWNRAKRVLLENIDQEIMKLEAQFSQL